MNESHSDIPVLCMYHFQTDEMINVSNRTENTQPVLSLLNVSTGKVYSSDKVMQSNYVSHPQIMTPRAIKTSTSKRARTIACLTATSGPPTPAQNQQLLTLSSLPAVVQLHSA